MSERYVYQYFDIAPQKKSKTFSSSSSFADCGFFYRTSLRQFKAKLAFVDSFPEGYTTALNGNLDYKGEVINTGNNDSYFKPVPNGADAVELQWSGADTPSYGTLLLIDDGDTSAENYHRMRGRYMILQSMAAANTMAIIQNAHNDTDRVLARLDAMENARKDERIAQLQSELQSARFQASQNAQNEYISAVGNSVVSKLQPPAPVPSYQVPNPFTGCCGVPTCGGCGTC